jgi:nitrite reductase/ring-hydroxylating ferredoxin subunit
MTTVEEDAALTLEYRKGLNLSEAAEDRAMALMGRLVRLYNDKSTEQADGTWQEPVTNYRDDALFEAERELLYKRIPLPLALSVELSEPNSYKALDVMGVPVVITRDAAGQVRAMLNICRHRGAQLCAPGSGTGRVMTCPYHAWSFGMDGELKGVYGESTFGEIDRPSRGLHQLPCEERHGIIFVCLTPGLTMDLTAWLGDMAPILDDLRLDELHTFSSRMMPGPNWKVVIEGYLEGYHFAALHKNTVFKTNLGNISAFDSFGPHARIAFGLRPLAEAASQPPETWEPSECVGPIVWVFPGLAIAGGWRDRMSVSLPLPGLTRDETVTEQRIMMRTPPSNERELHEAEFTRDWFYDVVYNEDYLTGYGVQRGVLSLPEDDTQIFGRNEIGVQHFHRTVNRLMAENADGVHAQPRVVS